jgi:hypothetical protein
MATTHPTVDRPFRVGPTRVAGEPASRRQTAVAGGVLLVPLMIFAPPLPIILAGLAVVYVLGATSSLADDRHARRR